MGLFDMIGPVMIGPSSSHTAGAARLGRMGLLVLGEKPVRAKIYLHGSFRDTYRGHGTDRAIIAGLMGFSPDDTRIRQSLELAEQANLQYEFVPANLGEVHPNTVKMELEGVSGHHAVMMGCSVGGGSIVITEVNGYQVHITGQYPVLVVPHTDKPGYVAKVTQLLADNGVNIARMQLSRRSKGADALMVMETDQAVLAKILTELNNIPGIQGSFALDPL